MAKIDVKFMNRNSKKTKLGDTYKKPTKSTKTTKKSK